MTAVSGPAMAQRRGWTDIGVMTIRNLRRNVRLPQMVLFATVQPVMFLLLFNYVFGGAMSLALPPAAGGQYINWLIPGLLIQVAVFGAAQTAVGLTIDLQSGVVDRFRSLPMARSAVLAGRTLSDLIRNVFVIGLMLGVGLLVGFRYQTSVLSLVAGFGLAMLFTFAFSWIMATLGLIARDPETAQSVTFIPLFPLVFASSVFTPTGAMPGWLRAFADNQPVSVVANAVRGLVLGQGALPAGATVTGTVVAAIVWSTLILAVFVPLSVRLYRRVTAG